MPSQQTKPQVELRRHLGRPTVFIDSEPHPLPGYNFHRDHVPLFSKHKMGVYLIEPMPAPGTTTAACSGWATKFPAHP